MSEGVKGVSCLCLCVCMCVCVCVCLIAENIFTPDAAEKFLISKIRAPSEPTSTTSMGTDDANATNTHALGRGGGNARENVFLLYCEFSSERAPRMFRHIRNLDRRMNLKTYPNLFWPHVLVIFGGFRAFYGHCVQWHKTIVKDMPLSHDHCDIHHHGDGHVCDASAGDSKDAQQEVNPMVADLSAESTDTADATMMPLNAASQSPTKAKTAAVFDGLEERAPAAVAYDVSFETGGNDEEELQDDNVQRGKVVDLNTLPIGAPAFVHGGYVKMNSVLYSEELRKIHAEMKRAWRRVDREMCT